MHDAGLEPSQIGYINAHGTSTIVGNKAETEAMKSVFGKAVTKVPISSTKSMIGHLLGEAGAIESIFSILALCDQMIPPTINLHNQYVECDLDFVPNVFREVKGLKYSLSNSFGFGGTNGSFIFGKLKAES